LTPYPVTSVRILFAVCTHFFFDLQWRSGDSVGEGGVVGVLERKGW
jgi:hypothetical protein